MIGKAIVLREAADDDISFATTFYTKESSVEITLRFLASLEQAFQGISKQPAIGSPRFAHELDLPGLRSWLLPDFPYVIFYVELADYIQVWRLLHTKRDLGASLETPQL